MIRFKKWHFKSIIKEIFIALLLLFVLSNVISYLRKPTLPSSALPNIEAKLIDGSLFHIERGKPLLIHFWATWCPSCKLEASNIETVSQHYNVLTIAVNSGSTSELRQYMQDHDLHFKVINDTHGIWAKQFKVQAFPTSFIYDAKGKLGFTEVGYTSTLGLIARLEAL
ncbi:MAG: protein disulfide oxidoreductase [Epsilonproteobacteria bacterium]|nr:MAG: protein disulfide oxidoreductase [Campylobacterota bacterium]